MKDQGYKKYKPTNVWLTVTHAVLGSFIFTYNIGVFTSTQPCVSASLNWGSNTSFLIAFCSALLPLGAMFGAIMSGVLSNHMGRRSNMILADIIIIIASVVTIIPFTVCFAVGRFLSGVGIGNFSALVPLYINEVSPAEISGRTGSLIQFFGCVGSICAFGFALVLPVENYKSDPLNDLWIGMFLFQGFVALIQLTLFCFFFRHETATWLVINGRNDEALLSLKFIYKEDNAEEILGVLKTNKLDNNNSGGTTTTGVREFTYKELLLCSGGTSKAMRLGLLLSIIQQFSGINAILSYATTIFGHFGSGVFVARFFTMLTGIVRLIAWLGLFHLIDKIGRKRTLIAGCVGMSISLTVMGFFSLYPEYYIIPFLVIQCYLALFAMSIGPICWIYSGEILTVRGMSICTAVNWFSAFIVVFFFPFMIQYLGAHYTFWFYAFVNFVGVFYFSFEMIETKGMMKSEIIEVFSLGVRNKVAC